MQIKIILFVAILFFLFSITLAQDLSQGVPANLGEMSYAELDSLMYLAYSRGYYKKAIPYMRAGREKARLEFDSQDSVYIEYTNNLGIFYYQTGQYQKAEQLLLEVLNIYALVSGKDHLDYAFSLNNLAGLYHEMNKYVGAEQLYIEAINIYSNTSEMAYMYAAILNNLGVLYRDMGSYLKAEPLFIEAKNIRARSLGKEHPEYAQSLNNLANLYQDMGRYIQVEPLFIEAKNIRARVLGKEHPYYAQSLNNLAFLYQEMGSFIKAETLYLKAKSIYAKIFGVEHPNYSVSLNNLAILYQKMGRLDSAYVSCLESIDANSVYSDSNFYSRNPSDYLNDTSFSDVESLDLFDYYSSHQINASFNTLLKIVKAQYVKGKDNKKLEQHYMIVQVVMRFNERLHNEFSSEGDKLRILKANSHFVKHGIESAYLLRKDIYIQEAFSFAEQNKSILLADAVKGNRARVFGDLPDSLAEKEILLQKKMTGLRKKQVNSKSQEQKNQINKSMGELNLEIDGFLKSLKDKYPKYHALKYQNFTAKVDDIQSLLDEKTLLLEFFQTDSILYLFTVSQQTVELHPVNVSRVVLREKIRQLRNTLSSYSFITQKKVSSYRTFTESASWFYKNLIEIVIKGKDAKSLIIIADGELGHLPFDVFLMTPAPQRSIKYNNLNYLIKSYNISYNYSATLWKENLIAAKKNNNARMLACGASYSTIDSSLLLLRGPNFFNLRGKLQPLPAVQQEVTVLSENFRGDFLLGNSANEKFFKENAHNYSIIHLAMHGVSDSRTPMLSSLAFTENRDSVENNFLQAYEIAHLNLNSDLVVLSACETGYGQFEQGEGIVSLARSFMYAGVSSLVVSLWEVNDNSTAIIMTSFYKNLAKGMPKDLALRQAKLDYIKSAKGIMAHPAFWSPFIQLGDSRPVNLSTTNSWFEWILCGAFLLLVLSGVVIIKRKYKA